MGATGRTCPPLTCPAQHGKGADIGQARFTLVVDDCYLDADGRHTGTEIFGFFGVPGQEHDNSALLTDILEVPAGSPIALMAHFVAGSPALAGRVEAALRRNVGRCPCTARTHCPALNDLSLLSAIEQAIAGEGAHN